MTAYVRGGMELGYHGIATVGRAQSPQLDDFEMALDWAHATPQVLIHGGSAGDVGRRLRTAEPQTFQACWPTCLADVLNTMLVAHGSLHRNGQNGESHHRS